MLVRNFNLMDIKKYESDTGANILSFFDDIRLNYVIDLVKLGNGNCDEQRAAEILDQYLENEGTLVDAILEIKEALIGVGDNNQEDTEETDKIDITQYDSLTDLYITFCMQLTSVGLSYGEFWTMTTKEMYKVFNSIAIKIQNETNRDLRNYHTLAAMVGGAVWGKLQKEPPKVDMTTKNKTVDGKSADDVLLLAQLEAWANSFNKNKAKGDEE